MVSKKRVVNPLLNILFFKSYGHTILPDYLFFDWRKFELLANSLSKHKRDYCKCDHCLIRLGGKLLGNVY